MSSADVSRCPVCSSDYETEGDRVPLLLTCTHSVCRRCIRRKLLRKGTSFDCPECGEENQAPNGLDGVRTNSYLLHFLSMDQTPEVEEVEEKCRLHKKRKSLFCNDCSSLVCCSCVKDPKLCHDHDFGDPEETKKQRVESFTKTLGDLKNKIKTNREKLIEVMVNENDNCDECLREVEANREEQVRKLNERFAKLTQSLADKKSKMNQTFADAVKKLDENLVVVDQMEANGPSSHKDISDALEKFYFVKSLTGSILAETKLYEHVSFVKCSTPNKTVKNLCGEIKEVQRRVKFTKIKDKKSTIGKNKEGRTNENSEARTNDEDSSLLIEQPPSSLNEQPSNSGAAGPSFSPACNGQRSQIVAESSGDEHNSNWAEGQPPAKRMRNACAEVDRTVVKNTEYFQVHSMTMLVGSVVLYGDVKNNGRTKYKLTKYDRATGTVEFERIFKDEIQGMAEVMCKGVWCLALGIMDMRRIDFHKADNLEQVVSSFSVAFHRPYKIISTSKRSLIVASKATGRLNFIDMDCSGVEPLLGNVKFTLEGSSHRSKYICDMVFLTADDKGMIVTSHGPTGIFAYEAATGKIEWYVKGVSYDNVRPMDARGLAVDNQNNINVCDVNNHCIQVFSSRGEYLGRILKDQNLLSPMRVSCCQKTSLLTIAYRVGDFYTVGMFQRGK